MQLINAKVVCSFLLMCTVFCHAQESISSKSAFYNRLYKKETARPSSNGLGLYPIISLTTSYGINMVGDDEESIIEKPNYGSVDIRGGYQTYGRSIYDQLWRYPEWGLGYFGTDLYGDSVFGAPNAAYMYIDVPFSKYNSKKKWSFSYSIGGGLSFNFRPNNPQENPFNTLIGSYNNVFIDLSFWANYDISRMFYAKMGLSFVHFSNGASSLPNKGMNLFGPKLVLAHKVAREDPERIVREVPEWRKRHGLFIYQAIGSKQLEEGGTNYINTTTGLGYKYWWSYKGQIIGQVDFFYDGSNNSGEGERSIVPIEDRGNSGNHWSIGIFAGYEAIYARWSFVSGWGIHLLRNYQYTSTHYQRFGIRYRVYQGLSIGAGLKARTFAADYIEWSFGYDLF